MSAIFMPAGCAQIYNPFLKAYTTSIGWPNAAVQGEVAAFNLLGDHRVIKYAGRKYFDLEGVKIKTTNDGHAVSQLSALKENGVLIQST